MTAPDLTAAEREALDAYRQFDGDISDMRSAVLVMEEVIENMMTPADRSFCRLPEFITYLLNDEQERAFRYAIHHVGDLARGLMKDFDAIEPRRSALPDTGEVSP